MNKTNILICVDWFTPAFKGGGPIRSVANLVDQIKDDYNIYLFTSAFDLGDTTPLSNIELDKWIQHAGIQVFYASSPLSTLRDIAKSYTFSTVYINSLFSFPFGIFPALVFKNLREKNSTKVVVAPRGMLQKGALQTKPLKKQLYLKAARVLGIYRDVTWHATDATEVTDIQKHFRVRQKIACIPNLPVKPLSDMPAVEKSIASIRLVYYSIISEKKNLLFLLEILNNVSTQIAISLDVYGPVKDAAYFERCKNYILNSNIVFNYLGAINPARQHEVLPHYHLFALPTKGENFGHAIFESMAHALPVLISDQTPWQSLEKEKAGWGIPLSDTEEYKKVIEFVAALDEQTLSVYRYGALNYAKKYYTQQSAVRQYLELLS